MNQEAMAGVLSAMKEYFDRSTGVLEEADSTFAPKEGMFTASQHVAHAAQTRSWFVQGAFAPEGFDLDFERICTRRCAPTASVRAAARQGYTYRPPIPSERPNSHHTSSMATCRAR